MSIRQRLIEKRQELEVRIKSFVRDSDWDFNRELFRKMLHLLTILYVIIYFTASKFFSPRAGLLALSCLLILLIELEYVRIELKAKIPVLSYLWERFKRNSENKQLGGEVFMLLGAIIVFASFDKRVAVTAVLMNTFGDLTAALFGKHFCKFWIFEKKKKALEGAIAEFFVNLFVGFLFLRTLVDGSVWWLSGFAIFGSPLWIPIIIMAFVATAVETCVSKIDDNLLIPVFSGFAGHVVLILMGYGLF